MIERIYSPKDLAKLLEIDVSTLRKYAELLERSEYRFLKNERGHRAYYDKDVIALRKFIEISKNNAMTLEMAAKALMTWVNEEDAAVNASKEAAAPVRYERYESEMQELKTTLHEQGEIIQKQTELLEYLAKKMDEQQRFLSNRDAEIMTAIRNIQETKRLAAAAKENRSIWSRLFGRGDS